MKTFALLLLLVLLCGTFVLAGRQASGCYDTSCNANIAAVTAASTLSEDEEVVEEFVATQARNSEMEVVKIDATGVETAADGCIGSCVAVTQNLQTPVFKSCIYGFIKFPLINGVCPSLGDLVSMPNLQTAHQACVDVGKCVVATGTTLTGGLKMFQRVYVATTHSLIVNGGTIDAKYAGDMPVAIPAPKGVVIPTVSQIISSGIKIAKKVSKNVTKKVKRAFKRQ